jgi:hypothetical protein
VSFQDSRVCVAAEAGYRDELKGRWYRPLLEGISSFRDVRREEMDGQGADAGVGLLASAAPYGRESVCL